MRERQREDQSFWKHERILIGFIAFKTHCQVIYVYQVRDALTALF